MVSVKIEKKYLICFLVIWVVQMAAAFYFCTQKQGFHEDEYYTYYSTARTNGFYVEDGQWMERETYRDEFVVLQGQRFQYGLVKLVQSWDVHPPMYYWVFHTVASFVPNVFSKWIGLSVNLFFHGINIILLTYLSYLVSGKDARLSLLVTLVYGLSPAAMSGVVFIRMYEMLTTFVLSCAILHMRAVERGARKLPTAGCLLPMAAVTYVGFLTQYYYFIFLFFLAAAFCVWLLWRDRNLWNCLRYGVSQGAALALAYLTYPSCLGQMFRGQRGAQATENFFDLSNTLGRLWFFLNLMNGYVFGYVLFIMLLVIVLLAWTLRRRGTDGICGRTQCRAEFSMLLFTAAGYFLTVSKTALLLGETSNRYQLPIYGIIVLLTLLAAATLWRRIFGGNAAGRRKSVRADAAGQFSLPKPVAFLIPVSVKLLAFIGELLGDLCRAILALAVRNRKCTERLAVVFCLAVIVMGHLRTDVVFLYPEDREQTACAGERAAENVPVVYLYQSGEEWCVWDVTNELLAYPRVYFAAAENTTAIADDRIRNADAVVVYLAKGADAAQQMARFHDGDPASAGWKYELMFEEKYCDVYYLAKESALADRATGHKRLGQITDERE